MRSFVLSCALLSTFVAVGCSSRVNESPSDERTHDELGTSSAENTDVQVISAKASGLVSIDNQAYDFTKCRFYDKQPAATSQYTSDARADCTDVIAAGQKRPPVNVYHGQAAIRENPNVSYVSLRYWCEELDVTVAVKAAAWDSPNFQGIGFYGRDGAINEKPEEQHTFYAKDDLRLVRVGEATLKREGGQKVYLYRFGGAGPCEVNGSGDNPSHSFELKPMVRYKGGIERWEAVSNNHGVAYQQSWDRRADLLDP